jgi:hypothetical protein
MHRLGQISPNPSDRKRRLQAAAEDGHVPAMFDLAMLCGDPRERRRWLQEAARNGWQEAVAELVEGNC